MAPLFLPSIQEEGEEGLEYVNNSQVGERVDPFPEFPGAGYLEDLL